jgi:hypothetical protein
LWLPNRLGPRRRLRRSVYTKFSLVAVVLLERKLYDSQKNKYNCMQSFNMSHKETAPDAISRFTSHRETPQHYKSTISHIQFHSTTITLDTYNRYYTSPTQGTARQSAIQTTAAIAPTTKISLTTPSNKALTLGSSTNISGPNIFGLLASVVLTR